MRFLLALLLILWPLAGLAQQSDRDFLTGFLEDNLSGAGRQVVITGFAGALSSQASMAEMTIADDQGIWLTLKDVTLDWDRAALLSGQIEIANFSVGEIDLDRRPAAETPAMPSPEARGFTLPSLPVSVNIGKIAARHIRLGPAVLGQEVEGTLTASMRLAGGSGSANLDLTRTDGPKGHFSLIGGYSAATGQLSLALTAQEEAGGVAVSLLGVPSAPSADLIIAGSGPVSDFNAKVALKTDGVTRLAGDVALTGDAQGSGFSVDLAGDPTPVFLPQYAAFFGHALRLQAQGRRAADGGLALSKFSLQAQALALDGTLSIDAQGQPQAFNLTGQMGLADGSVVLPLTTERETRLRHADVSLSYDRATGDTWQGQAVVQGLDHAAFTAETMTLAGSGRIATDAAGPLFDGRITFDARGLAMADPGLAQALGSTITGGADLAWKQGDGRLSVSDLSVEGAGYKIATTGGIGGLGDGFALKGTAAGQYDDLSRLSILAGRPLAGQLAFDLTGEGSPLSGFFDVEGSLKGKALATGIAQLDGLLKGDSAFTLSVRRDATGTTINALDLTAAALTAKAQGRITSEGSSLTADLDFSDISVLGPGYHGSLQGKASLVGNFETGTASLEATGLNLAMGQDQADRLMAGQSTLSVAVTFDQGTVVIDRAAISTPQATLSATGRAGAVGSDISAQVTLADLSVLGAAYRGSLDGTAHFAGRPDNGSLSLEARATDLAMGQAQLDRLLNGQSDLSVALNFDVNGAVIERASVTNPQATLEATGTLALVGSDLAVTLTLPELAVLTDTLHGGLRGTARFAGTPDAGSLDFDGTATDLALGQPQLDRALQGPSTVSAAVRFGAEGVVIDRAAVTNRQVTLQGSGHVAAAGSDISAGITADLSALGGGYRGALQGQGQFTGTASDGHLVVSGTASNLGIGSEMLDKLLRGQSALALDLNLAAGNIRVNQASLTNPQVTAKVGGTAGKLELDARLADLGLLFPQFPGALTARGTGVLGDSGYQTDLTVTGPGGIDASVKGSLAGNFASADLAIAGSATAALANRLAAPRSLSGPVRFDLRLQGPLKPSSLSGRIAISGGRLADPGQSFALQDIAGSATLAGGRAQVALDAGVSTGGQVAVTGSVGLDAPYPADLAIDLQGVVLRDPDLYRTVASGALTFKGPATGGALIAGRISLGPTELRIPSTGLGADGDLPGLEHVHEPADVHETRVRAGLLGTGGSGGSGGAGYGLNLTISAPNQVFLRGRGLDAELGGSLTLRGTTNAIVPAGAFNLIRGRLDILGRRLVLSEAMLQMQGALVPFVRILASVESDGITASVLIEGPANDPAVTFTSSPDLPQEEVLARLLFDRGLENITAFQAIQLAGAVASLAGRGGEGLVGNLRRKAGLDNLDVKTDATGNTAVTAGKYLSDKLYTEVTVDQGGKSSVSLNLDVTSHITLKGHVDADGQTGLGVFLQKDY